MIENDKYKTIKEWASEDRPREKMIEKGADALSNAELLAIMINTGTANKSALDIAKELMFNCHGNLLELSKLTFIDFKKIKGLGEKKAVTLLAALELGKRRQLSAALDKPYMRNSKQVFEVLAPLFFGKTREEFYVLFMMHNSKLISIENISNGGVTSTIVDVRIIFKKALELNSVTKIIVAHNHPSGNNSPSEADRMITKRIAEAGKILDIVLYDHIIIAGDSFFSFADEGML